MSKFNEDFIQNLNKILNEKDISIKTSNIFDIYNKMNYFPKKESNIKKEENNKQYQKVNNKNEEKKENINNQKEESKEQDNSDKINEDDNNKTNKSIKIIKMDKDLMNISENNKENDFNNLDITKLKDIITLESKDHLSIIVLNDGRIVANHYDSSEKGKSYCFVYDLKKNFYFKFVWKDDPIYDIFPIEDNVILVHTSGKLYLVEVEEANIETIQKIELNFDKIYGPYNNKIFFQFENSKEEQIIHAYVYKNKKLKFEKKIQLNSMKKLNFNPESNDDCCLINEKEIGVYYYENGFLGEKSYFGFFDLEKDKKIQSFQIPNDAEKLLCLINKDILVYTVDNKIYPVHLKNHSKKKEIKLENWYIDSIVVLNEKKFLVNQKKYLNQFEIDKDNKIMLTHSIDMEIDSFYESLYKYPKDRLLTYKWNGDKNAYIICLCGNYDE